MLFLDGWFGVPGLVVYLLFLIYLMFGVCFVGYVDLLVGVDCFASICV